jgi:predicted dehydrogenase
MTPPRPPPPADRPLRLAMLGMIPGNGHPYSWSAILNGYDEAAMATCPYPVIPRYLGARRELTGTLPARVTHLWTDDPAEAPAVAAAALIPHVVARPEAVIGAVDAVLIATDDGDDHVRRAAPFVAAGLPVFVDKPLATNEADLATFARWHHAGAALLSSSGLRYDPAVDRLRAALPGLGAPRWATGLSVKTWERYGIHLLEPLLAVLGPGLHSVALAPGTGQTEVATLTHAGGAVISIAVVHAGTPGFGQITLVGDRGVVHEHLNDTFHAFRGQLAAFVDFVRTGRPPLPFAATLELMAALIAGRLSRAAGGPPVPVPPIVERVRRAAASH